MVNQNMTIRDRRRHPRVFGNIPVKIRGEEFDAVTETKNLSRSGAFCQVDKQIEPMTKLKIQLLLSYKRTGKVVTRKISCEGIVVRSEAVSGQPYFDTAIYFNDIQEKDAGIITDYVHFMLDRQEDTEG